MTKITSTPERFAGEALAGFAAAFPAYVRAVPGGVVRRPPPPDGSVALLVGGGSGHYPAFLGFVGSGLAAAAVAGEVFASPSTRRIVDVAREASCGGGVVLGFGNYAGDVLNFGAAARQLTDQGIPAQVLVNTDDVASAPPDQAGDRRGIAGGLVIFKVAGAAADAGADLATVLEIGRRCNDHTRSLGVAFAGCTLPGSTTPLFTIPPGRMGVGLGIHGEPGIDETDIVDAGTLASIFVDQLLAELPTGPRPRVAAVVNGLGATKYEELFVLWQAVSERLDAAGVAVVSPAVGEFYTSLDMAGCSLSLAVLDDELERLWSAPADTPAFRLGGEGPGSLSRGRAEGTASAPPAAPTATELAAGAAPGVPHASAGSQASATRVVAVLEAVSGRLAELEAELGRLDSVAGDGDHGSAMVRGSAAALGAAREAQARGAGVATALAVAADAWADRGGGTSGALWGVLLRAWAGALSDTRAAERRTVVAGARAAAEAVAAAGGARIGDKTMLDALVPFADALAGATAAGHDLASAWAEAAQRATEAAAGTAELRPRLGRARPLAERSVGHADPGAASLAECASAAGHVLAGGAALLDRPEEQ